MCSTRFERERLFRKRKFRHLRRDAWVGRGWAADIVDYIGYFALGVEGDGDHVVESDAGPKAKRRLLCPISGMAEPCSGILGSNGLEAVGDGLIEGFFSSRLDAAKELLEF